MVEMDNKEQVVNGDSSINITDYHWADNNQDHRIDDNEILAIYNSFDILKELDADIEEIRQAWINSKGNHCIPVTHPKKNMMNCSLMF